MTLHQVTKVEPQLATILVIEDDPDIQSLLEDLFLITDYNVLSTASGEDALAILEQENVDLIVLDIMLPDMSGYQICQHVRDQMGSHVPIIMLTALGHQPNVAQGLSLGADDYVKKPFAPDELMLRAKRLLQRQHETRLVEQEVATLQNMLSITQRQLELSRQETQVETTLRREFLHNVTTHMQALTGIVEATIRKLPPSAEREIVQQLKSRVRGAALVYQITEALQSDPVEIGQLIRTIASALKSMYRPWKRIVVEVHGDAIELPLMIASPLAMIVNELITNCFKHAFPDQRFGKISVRYTVQDLMFLLDITDDGVGFAGEPTSRQSVNPAITNLVHQLNGTIEWQSGPAATHVSVHVPVGNVMFA